jgi:hypothetical protein
MSRSYRGNGLKKYMTVVVKKGTELVKKISNILHLWQLKLMIRLHYRYLVDLPCHNFFKKSFIFSCFPAWFLTQQYTHRRCCVAWPNFLFTPYIHLPATQYSTLPSPCHSQSASKQFKLKWALLTGTDLTSWTHSSNLHIMMNTCILLTNNATLYVFYWSLCSITVGKFKI